MATTWLLSLGGNEARTRRAKPKGPLAWLQHTPSLVASLAPGVMFGAGVATLRGSPAFPELAHLSTWPLQLAIMGVCGGVATVAGIADWIYHRQEGIVIGWKERRAELLALTCGGLPMFVIMTAATFARDPRPWIIPLLIAVVATAVMIAFDEFVYHRRRSGPFETLLHRALVFGHAGALLAWVHLVFVRGGFRV